MINNSTYYIERLKENPVNQYKWIYIDSSDGSLKIIDNKWYFNIKFYMIQNLLLPVNVFNVDMSSQFTTVKDVTINVTDMKNVPDWVIQKEYCTCYSMNLEFDTNETKFFEQALTSFEIYIKFHMNVDTETLNTAKVSLDQDEYDEFVNECNEQTSELKFLYSNYEEYKNMDGTIQMPNEYYLNSFNGSYPVEEIVYYQLNNQIEQTDNPIKYLMTMQLGKEYTVLSKKVKFTYQLYGSDPKDVIYEITTPEYGAKTLSITYDQFTYFKESDGTIINEASGIDGFYCPLACVGYYEVSINLSYKHVSKTLKFVNNFSFKGNDDFKNKKIRAINTFIQDVTTLQKEIEF